MLHPDLSGRLKDRWVQVQGRQDCPGFVKPPRPPGTGGCHVPGGAHAEQGATPPGGRQVAGAKARSLVARYSGCPTASETKHPTASTGRNEPARRWAGRSEGSSVAPAVVGCQDTGARTQQQWSCSPNKDVSHRARCVYKEYNLVSFSLG